MSIEETQTTAGEAGSSPPPKREAPPGAGHSFLHLTIRELPLKQAPMEAVIRRET